MNKYIPYILTDNSVTIVVGGKPYTMADSNSAFLEVKNRLTSGNTDGIERLFDTGAAVGAFTKGNIVVNGDSVLYKGQVVNNHLVDRILAFMRDGLPYKPLVAFLDNLMQNPSFRAVTELYGFLEASKLPITDDGCFLAYRKVTTDFRDFYTGKLDNSVGKVVEMTRNLVDEDKNRTCSYGLHFCAFTYLSHYHGGSGRTVMVKINPADVVAIPTDYNNAKGRCCKYEVISEIPNEVEQTFGALYKTSPEEAFDDNGVEDADIVNEVEGSYELGFDAGEFDAEDSQVRDADQAFLNDDDGSLNELDYVKGYHAGYDSVTVNVKQAVAPKAKVTVSDKTRRKLSRIAKKASRDSSGRFA